jgi:5-formyltetrahydrofolate cyclo-ligase
MKDEIRRQMIARRAALAPEEATQAAIDLSRQLRLFLLQLDSGQPAARLRIAAYSAMRQEASLNESWQALAAWPADLYFPAVRGRGSSADLVFGKLPDGLPPENFLVPGRFGIAEPPQDNWLAEPPDLDVILVPGVAFDRQGGRIGWGRAFYDRLLQVLPGRPVRAGICYPFQIVPDSLPQGPGDERMDWLLTPQGFFRC